MSTSPPSRKPAPAARLEELMVQAFEEGRRLYGPLPLSREAFGDELLQRARRRLEKEGLPATSTQLARLLELMAGRDLFLSTACDRNLPGAWEAFHERTLVRLPPILIRQGARPAEAAELVEELPGELIASPGPGHATRLAGFDGSGSLLAWLATIAMRKLARKNRRQRPQLLGALPEELFESPAHLSPTGRFDPVQEASATEGAAQFSGAIEAAWQRLTEREREVVALCFGEGLKHREIAKRLKVGVPRVSRLQDSALKKLRERVHLSLGPEGEPEGERQWAGLREMASRTLAGLGQGS